jgi:hypothetical protein
MAFHYLYILIFNIPEYVELEDIYARNYSPGPHQDRYRLSGIKDPV